MHFQAFDTFEDMQAAINTALANANEVAKTHPIKIEMLLPGTKFLMVDKEAGEIFGEVIGHAGPDTDLTDEEREYDRQQVEESRKQGFVFARCYGWGCPDGEYGDVHVVTVLKILTDEDFAAAREAGWRFVPRSEVSL